MSAASPRFQSCRGAEPVSGSGFCSLLITFTGLCTFGFQPDWKQQTLESSESFSKCELPSLPALGEGLMHFKFASRLPGAEPSSHPSQTHRVFTCLGAPNLKSRLSSSSIFGRSKSSPGAKELRWCPGKTANYQGCCWKNPLSILSQASPRFHHPHPIIRLSRECHAFVPHTDTTQAMFRKPQIMPKTKRG